MQLRFIYAVADIYIENVYFRDLALHSVKEAVKLAQETSDKNCLQHALVSQL